MNFNKRQLAAGAAAIAMTIVAGAAWVLSGEPNIIVSPSQADPSVSDLMVAGPLGDMTLGDPKAPNTVIEYASMTCTHCARFHNEVYRAFKAKYIDTGKVYLIFRDYPLDDLARAAIIIAHCAPKERFFPLVDLMFDHQQDWAFVDHPDVALFNLVKQAGFTQATFDACLTNQTLLDGVNWVQDRAMKNFGVNATPTFFINGKTISGEQTLDSLDKVLTN